MSISSFLNQINILRVLAFVIEGSAISYLVNRIRDTGRDSLKNEQYLRGVLDSLFVFVGVISKDGVLMETNQASVDRAGLRFKDVIGKNIVDSYWWSYSKASKNKLEQSLEDASKGKSVRYDAEMRVADGEIINVDFSLAPLKNPNDLVEYLVLLAVDVNQRTETLNENKKLYREVKRQKRITDNIIANIPGIVWELRKNNDGSFKINFVSEYEEVVLGYKIGTCENDPNLWKNIIYKEDRNRVLKEIEKVFIKQKPQVSQFRCVNSDRKVIWVDARFAANTDDEGRSIGVEGVLTDISERIKMEQTKDEFVSIASHEIKTPLTTIKAFAQIIESKLKQSKTKETVGYLHKMNSYIIQLNEVINDFMDFSKIESGKLEYYKEEFKLEKLVSEVVGDTQSITKTHKIFFTHESDGMVFGDKNRIAQVLVNLISNAIKYSPGAKKIMVNIEEKDEKAIISVTDFGIGIQIDNQKKIFEKFYRVKHPKKRNIEGFGLGLYISAEIIKRHGGKIWLNSEVDRGSTFFVSLPLILKSNNE